MIWLMTSVLQDASAEFRKYHSEDYLEDLPSGSCLGVLDPQTRSDLRMAKSPRPTAASLNENQIPPLSLCVRTSDFEPLAKLVLSNKSWVYASATANSGDSMKRNLDDWSRIIFRPRALRNVEVIDTRRSVLGHDSSFPFFVSSMGTLGSAHPTAEPGMVKALASKGVHAVISTASTKPTEEIMQTLLDEKAVLKSSSPTELFFQLYIPMDRKRARQLIQKVKKAGYKGLFITIDAPVLGKRTEDRYLQAQEGLEFDPQQETVLKEASGAAGGENSFAPAFGGRAVPGQLSSNLTWDDLEWIRAEWQGPIVLKGVQSASDAKLAVEHGCDGVLLSNHGGRQSHGAPSSLLTLLEIRTYYPEVFGKLEVFVDGGLRDGADVLKALCLGATAVGVGRPFLYALAVYGTSGVKKCIDSKPPLDLSHVVAC
jgi:L-lactate dehydrogenase (cytochrome)